MISRIKDKIKQCYNCDNKSKLNFEEFNRIHGEAHGIKILLELRFKFNCENCKAKVILYVPA